MQGAANGIELALNQHGIAPVQVAALDHGGQQALPLRVCLQDVGGGAEAGEFGQQIGFAALQLFKALQVLLLQGFKLHGQNLRQLPCHGQRARGAFHGVGGGGVQHEVSR